MYNTYNLFQDIPLRPPTIYAILDSMTDFEETIPIKDLVTTTKNKIFDFEYPLSQNVDKDRFEELILKKFLMRRIGSETVTAFKIKLEVKLNEIMGNYNMMFDAFKDWVLFNVGNDTTRTLTKEDIENLNSTTSSDSSTNSDSRFSDTPQNSIQNVKDGKYVTNYNYSVDNGNSDITSNSNTNKEENLLEKVTVKDFNNNIGIYNEFLEKKQNIYTMIFNDLEPLFYSVVD